MTYDYKQDFPIFQHTDVAYIDNFGKPDAVRIAGASPRQIAAVSGVPVQQYIGNVVHILSAKVAIFPFRLYI